MSTELNNAVTALQNVTDKHEQLNTQYQGTHDALASNTKAMMDWQTQAGTVELTDQNGNKHPTPTLKTLVEQAQSVNPHPEVMSKAQFDALRQMRKQQYAGSGFVEWGKHIHNSLCDSVNEGLWTWLDRSNTISIGVASSDVGGQGIASTKKGVAVIDGVITQLSQTAHPHYVMMLAPPAPDGTKTYDSTTGTVTKHSNAEVAFASETDTNKVITSRKDLVFLESWHEKIADKDVVYPLGNVQYGASGYQDIPLLNNLVAQGYSAFGEWDENTKGYGVKWSTLTDEQKAVFLSEPEHNIYFDPKAKAYIQVRYRVRVVEGLGDNWAHLNDQSGASSFERYLGYGRGQTGNVDFIAPRGIANFVVDWGADYPVFANSSGTWFASDSPKWAESSTGQFSVVVNGGNAHPSAAHDGKCHAVPIALVQRLNQGAFHPVYNPMGCRAWAVVGISLNLKWHSNGVAGSITSTSRCFEAQNLGSEPTPTARSGYIGAEDAESGRPDQYKYHDAIYAGQVEDLRLNANKLDVNQLREDSMRKAVAGTLRGRGKQLFTQFKSLDAFYFSSFNNNSNVYFRVNSNGQGDLVDFESMGFQIGESVMVWQPSTGYVGYGALTNHTGHLALHHSPNALGKLSGSYTSHLNQQERCYIAHVFEFATFDSLPWVDIIGDPEQIAATFPDGVVGQWIPKLPTGLTESFAANRKVTGAQHGVLTLDNGASWAVTSSTFNSVRNDFTNNIEANRVQLMHYESLSSFTESETSSSVSGSLDDVYFSADYSLTRGNRLMGSLCSTVGKSDQASKRYGNVKAIQSAVDKSGKVISNEYSPTHNELGIGAPRHDSEAFKALPTVIEKNGLLCLQFHGAVLKHNGTDWGDDQTIPIVDGENVKTDLNGNTVKVFCHHTQFPIGIAYNN
ncbi:hypothetical protein HG263_06940 [Pseudoalteromonas sp. JBTF-M23]|uniref:Uncharacterized protein n=1 Tax=Pseudoalteromonas caenipelagi TaxID=2726988 RepID=A0A849VEW8_9GAMM|nr:hypothetical protein [Pseudoalteromonas caenipelagi]NOU50277.1 hypothetical protein [Pseudoalteromonas caenipelagi]